VDGAKTGEFHGDTLGKLTASPAGCREDR
jgi:hypothetical protein